MHDPPNTKRGRNLFYQPAVSDLLNLGWSMIPCGRNKRPVLKWRQYQHRAATINEILEWKHELKPSLFAVVTGQISGLVVLDFDNDLFVSLAPHVRTPSGGSHLYFEHPGWRVPTLNSKTKKELGLRWPGLDIRGDGGYAVCLGKTDRGYYKWLRDPKPYPLHIMPSDMREFFGLARPPAPPAPTAQKAPPPFRSNNNTERRVMADLLTARALGRAPADGRNNAGMWLAIQLRDNGFSQSEAQHVICGYAKMVPEVNLHGQHEKYSHHEALATLRSAYSRPAREPWNTGRRWSA